jgi:hypothetical protein
LIAGNQAGFGQSGDSSGTIADQRPFFFDVISTEVLVGINWLSDFREDNRENVLRFGEVGISRSIHSYGRHGPVSFGILLSEEFYTGKENLFGTKLGAYMHYLFDIGFSMVYYTDFKKGTFKLRPEMGVGVGGVRIVIGFNVPAINSKALEELKRKNAQITIQGMFPVKKKKSAQGESIIRKFFK